MHCKTFVAGGRKDLQGSKLVGWELPLPSESFEHLFFRNMDQQRTPLQTTTPLDAKRDGMRKEINKKRAANPIPYSKWNNMFIRCYNKKYKEKTPSYEGCSVCEEWRKFDNFLAWFQDPANGYREGYQLDKDLLVQGNKVYGPDTCCFIPQTVNAMMTRSNRLRGQVKSIGVTIKSGKYVARCNFGHKEAKQVGRFKNEQDAFEAYKAAKKGYIVQLANDLYTKGEITERVYKGLLNYEIKQYD